MTAVSAAPYSATRPHILVSSASGDLLAEERTAMMSWLPNCLRLQVPASATSAARVRHAARSHILDVFAADPRSPGAQIAECADTVELVVSELVTNALRYSLGDGSPISIELSSSTGDELPQAGRTGRRRAPAAVKVSVGDDNPEPPPATWQPDDLAESGRGLLIVEHHCVYADVVPTRSGGKRIRALVPIPQAALAEERNSRRPCNR